MRASMILSALALFPIALTAPSQRLPRQDTSDPARFDTDQPFDATAPPSDTPNLFGAPPAPPAAAPPSEPRQEDCEKKPKQPSSTPKLPANPKLAPASCDLSKVEQPASALQQPTPDMKLALIAIGHGTQNYTCANATAVPVSIGAVAQLFNNTCGLPSNTKRDASDAFGTMQESASASAAIGAHFFLDNTTPDFDVKGLGNTEAAKLQDAPAPNPAKDVRWLRLGPKAGSTSAVKAIYRLNTQGGMAPATCEGKNAGEVLAIEYEAQYWFYT
ncbi:malate dehydrogenase [Pyrenophora seminiperda CCB06]|uniref:Malate dehydrogenase n=1 Tax=Pyrenophora seminiperda CCB06 TaxID=1302712 RepID=A0A3M7MIJ8_9PLEO|nr:malate dehydrogenase [Pyrenophora seminiperda CCB06]